MKNPDKGKMIGSLKFALENNDPFVNFILLSGDLKFDDDKTPLPSKKVMDWYKWEKKDKKYTYQISWGANKLLDSNIWEGVLIFNDDFT